MPKSNDYANLDSVVKVRGDLERAGEFWTKARDLFARIGMPHKVKQMQEWLDELPDSAAKVEPATSGDTGSKGAAMGETKTDAKPKRDSKGEEGMRRRRANHW